MPVARAELRVVKAVIVVDYVQFLILERRPNWIASGLRRWFGRWQTNLADVLSVMGCAGHPKGKETLLEQNEAKEEDEGRLVDAIGYRRGNKLQHGRDGRVVEEQHGYDDGRAQRVLVQ